MNELYCIYEILDNKPYFNSIMNNPQNAKMWADSLQRSCDNEHGIGKVQVMITPIPSVSDGIRMFDKNNQFVS